MVAWKYANDRLDNSTKYNKELEESRRKLQEAQRQKKNDLNNYVNSANPIVIEMKKMIDDARLVSDAYKSILPIPEMVRSACSILAQTSISLQKGISVDGVPAGRNCATDATKIPADINSAIDQMKRKMEEYINRKHNEFDMKKSELENIKLMYDSRLSSYPADLGIYSPAPSFPEILVWNVIL